MDFYNICFSPTGGTGKVADVLAEGLFKESIRIDLTDKETDYRGLSFRQDDVVLIAVPSYSGRVPVPAVERIALLRGNGAKAVLVCVYGNRAYEDTLMELRDTVAEAGFQVVAAVAAVAEHSIVRRYGAGRPDEQDRVQLRVFAGQIRIKLLNRFCSEPKIPGNHPYRKANAVGMIPRPTHACTNCGLCARKCPVGAIDEHNPRNVDRQACISCMRCVTACPRKARKISPFMHYVAGILLKKACSRRKDNELFL